MFLAFYLPQSVANQPQATSKNAPTTTTTTKQTPNQKNNPKTSRPAKLCTEKPTTTTNKKALLFRAIRTLIQPANATTLRRPKNKFEKFLFFSIKQIFP
jgi:hypothetical protein